MKKTKAELFCIRLNKLNRFSNSKKLVKRLSLIHEFKATPCCYNYTKFRIDNTMIELNADGKYEVKD